jgi:hypothetical protein
MKKVCIVSVIVLMFFSIPAQAASLIPSMKHFFVHYIAGKCLDYILIKSPEKITVETEVVETEVKVEVEENYQLIMQLFEALSDILAALPTVSNPTVEQAVPTSDETQNALSPAVEQAVPTSDETQNTTSPTVAQAVPTSVVTEKERGLIDWSQNFIEATGMAVAPKGTTAAQGRALARRGAIVDLQRNMLEFLYGVQIDARTVMDDFMAEDRVRSEVNGAIRNIELLKGEWNAEEGFYVITGRIRLAQVRTIVAPSIPVNVEIKAIVEEEKKATRTATRYTGLIIDVRHLPLVPSMTFRVFDENGRAVYGMEFVDQAFFLQSGLCSYFNNINYAAGDIHFAPNPISARATRLGANNVDIVIPNSAASMVRGSSFDFRREGKIAIVSR